jgi:lipoprotein-releasing system ATP-binding protein
MKMNTKTLQVEDIEYQYKNGKKVVYVESFCLYRGELVFLLGPSGIGKSTFIEAIGLINNTGFKANSNSKMQYLKEDRSYDLIQMWEDHVSVTETFRREHFSFIFQNNYLMPNLTAGENMMMTLLMKGESEQYAQEQIKKYMQVVDLKEEVVSKNVFNLSGGQKQRLAFVRAIASPFHILIGDEPTGNLDILTSRSLMNFTRSSILENAQSGIFVSHDIRLALTYADRIYLFVPEKNGAHYYGQVGDGNMYNKENGIWKKNGMDIQSPYDEILSVFTEII